MWKLVNSGGAVKQKFYQKEMCDSEGGSTLHVKAEQFGGSFRPFPQQIFLPRANNPETTWRRLGKSQSTDGIRYLD